MWEFTGRVELSNLFRVFDFYARCLNLLASI
jgi:hypothetical protein